MDEGLHDASRFRRMVPNTGAVVFLACVLGFFYWGFLSGRCFIWEDTLTQFYPYVNYFARSIHSGRLPLWFPGVHDGMPFYCDPQSSVFYPLQWLLIPFVRDDRLPFMVYQRYIVLHYFLKAKMKSTKCDRALVWIRRFD